VTSQELVGLPTGRSPVNQRQASPPAGQYVIADATRRLHGTENPWKSRTAPGQAQTAGANRGYEDIPLIPIMFYDGGCQLCRREVAHYRRLDHAGLVRWVDITQEPEALAVHGIDPLTAMRRLHAIDEGGRVVSGVAAFAAIWRQLPGYRHLAGALARLGLIAPIDRLYEKFADWRFRRRCREGVCAPQARRASTEANGERASVGSSQGPT